jgi:hypothetical protein
MYSVGKKIGPYTVVKQIWEQYAYYCTNEERKDFLFSVAHEILADLEKSQQGGKSGAVHPSLEAAQDYYQTILTKHNKGVEVNESALFPYSGLADTWFKTPIQQTQTKTQTTKTMTRLTTSGDWTIALNENNKLVAFDSNGQSITAVGSLIYANGRAWMWNGGKLWSGVMEHVEGEAEARTRAEHEEKIKAFATRQKIIEKYNAKIQALTEQKIAALAEVTASE